MYFLQIFPLPHTILLLPFKRYEHYVGFEKRNILAISRLTPWEKKYLLGFTFRFYYTDGTSQCNKRLGQTKNFYEIWEEKILTIKFEQFIWFVYGLVFSFVCVRRIFHANWHVDFGASYTTRQCGQKKDREQSLWNSNNAPKNDQKHFPFTILTK